MSRASSHLSLGRLLPEAEKIIKQLKSTVREFPDSPGVYIMFDGQGNEIYVGKAKSLKKRASSYFQSRKSMDNKTMRLVESARNITCIQTDSEVEALLLESRLVKQLQPKYNIDLKAGERYPCLAVLKTDDYPRIVITRDRTRLGDKDDILFISRFTAVAELRAGMDVLQRIFRFRTCSLEIFDRDRKRKYARPCLLFHIKRCTGPCAARINRRSYMEDISRFISFLEGGKDDILRDLAGSMKKASDAQKYEDAARYRDELLLLERIAEDGGELEEGFIEAPIIDPEDSLQELQRELSLPGLPGRIEGIDISHTSGAQSVGSLVTFLGGKPCREEYRRYRIKNLEGVDDVSMIEEVVTRRIRRQLEEKRDLPDILLIDGGRGQVNRAAAVLEKFGVRDRIYAVGIAKREEILYPAHLDEGVRLPDTSPGLSLLRYVRDESHRFARLYHRLLRGKKFKT